MVGSAPRTARIHREYCGAQCHYSNLTDLAVVTQMTAQMFLMYYLVNSM
jgi:hypothetical protein